MSSNSIPHKRLNQGLNYDVFDSVLNSTPHLAKITKTVKKEKLASSSIQKTDLNSNSDSNSKLISEDSNLKLIKSKSGTITETLNNDIAIDYDRSLIQNNDRIRLSLNADPKKYTFRYMRVQLSEASEYLDERIENFISLIKDYYKFSEEEFGNPTALSQSEIIVVGRITCDQLEWSSNAKTLTFETCRRLSAGLRVPLNVDNLEKYFLYPGKIVAFKGKNPNGDEFVVSEEIQLPQLKSSASSRKALIETAEIQENQPIQIIAASGPYSTDDNLNYDVLDQLVSNSIVSNPDVIILYGPFINAEHALIKSGNFDTTLTQDLSPFESLFIEKITSQLKRLPSNTQVILIPHLTDAVSTHIVFPQEAFKKKRLQLPKNVNCLPNPCLFSINDITFGTTSMDILMHISRSKLSSNTFITDPSKICEEILNQRSFYPLFPGNIDSRFGEASLDISYCGISELDETAPDIMIFPSKLSSFAHVASNVICVNPSTLSMRKATGKYAKILINPAKLKHDDDDDEQIPHHIWERTKVEIIRI